MLPSPEPSAGLPSGLIHHLETKRKLGRVNSQRLPGLLPSPVTIPETIADTFRLQSPRFLSGDIDGSFTMKSEKKLAKAGIKIHYKDF